MAISTYSSKAAFFARIAHVDYPEKELRNYFSAITPGAIFTPSCAERATEEWDNFVGTIWKNVLQTGSVREDSKVLEVAPGEKSKVGIGLKYLCKDFAGRLTLIEPESDALSKIKDLYEELFRNANIIPLKTTLDGFIASPELLADTGHVQAVVANHGIDDMIIGKSMVESTWNSLFQNHYKGSEIEKMATTWHQLLDNPELLQRIKKQVAQEWVDTTRNTAPRLLALSAYRSCFFEKHSVQYPELVEADYQALDALTSIRYALPRENYRSCRIEPGKLLGSAQNWVVMTPTA
jgi:hypothetical protein